MGAMTSAPEGGIPAKAPTLRRAVSRLAICLAAALLTLPLFPAVANAAVTNASSNLSKMFQYMNAERAARGLSPLARDSRLDSLAQSWANKMAAERDMYHPNTPQAMTGAGYRSGGQNLAWHDTALSASWAHNWWMNSGPHRRDILDPAFTHTGLALACNPSGARPYVMAVVEFGGNSAPLKSTPPVEPQVAGGDSGAPAGCGGADSPPPPPAPPAPAPPPPPAPAPVAPPPAAAKSSTKPPATPAASRKASPSPSARASAASKTSPTPGAFASAKPKASVTPATIPIAGASPSPSTVATTSGGSPAARLDPVEVASAESPRNESGALVALVTGLSGILLMYRVGSRRRRVAPKHAISRR